MKVEMKEKFVNTFCVVYELFLNRLKEVKEAISLLNILLNRYFADRTELEGEKLLEVAFKKVLSIYFRCNNALYWEHEMLSKGLLSQPYHVIESKEHMETSDGKQITKVNINWLRKHVAKVLKMTTSHEASAELIRRRNIVKNANLNLDNDDFWLANDLRNQLKSNIHHLSNTGFQILLEGQNSFYSSSSSCPEPIIVKLRFGQRNIEIDSSIKTFFVKSRENIAYFLGPFCTFPTVTHSTKLQLTTAKSDGVTHPTQPQAKTNGQLQSCKENMLAITHPTQLHLSNAIVSPKSIESSSSATVLSKISTTCSSLSNSINDNNSIEMNHLRVHTSQTILQYSFNKLSDTIDYQSVVLYITKKMNMDIRAELEQKQQENYFAIEIVLRLLEYKKSFKSFFADLEKEASELKGKLFNELKTNIPVGERNNLSMKLLKLSRKHSFTIGFNVVQFIKFCLSQKRDELVVFFDNKVELLDQFTNTDMAEDFRKILNREDELFLDLCRDPFYTHKNELHKHIIENLGYFDSLQSTNLYLENVDKFPIDMKRGGSIVFAAIEKYKCASNPLHAIHVSTLLQQPTIMEPLNRYENNTTSELPSPARPHTKNATVAANNSAVEVAPSPPVVKGAASGFLTPTPLTSTLDSSRELKKRKATMMLSEDSEKGRKKSLCEDEESMDVHEVNENFDYEDNSVEESVCDDEEDVCKEEMFFITDEYKPEDSIAFDEMADKLFPCNYSPSENAKRVAYLNRRQFGKFENSVHPANLCDILLQPLMKLLGYSTVNKYIKQYSTASWDDQHKFLCTANHLTSTSSPSQQPPTVPTSSSLSSSSSSSRTFLSPIISLTNDENSISTHFGNITPVSVLSFDHRIRILLDMLVSVDLEFDRKKKVINACYLEGTICDEQQHNMSAAVIKSILAMLNLVVFALRHMLLRNILPIVCGDHFIKFLTQINKHGNNKINMTSFWNNIENFLSFPTLPGENSDDSFRTISFMWFEKIYEKTSYRLNYIGCIEVDPSESSAVFEMSVRNAINALYIIEDGINQKPKDDSMLLTSVKYSTADSNQKYSHSFPLVMRLDVAADGQQRKQAIYKLTGVYYIDGNGNETMLCVSAIDSLGKEFTFEWNSTLPKVETSSLTAIPSKCDSTIIEPITSNAVFPTKFKRTKQTYFAQGLLYILDPTQENLFKGTEKDHLTSKFVHVDIINRAGTTTITLPSIKKILQGESKEWLNDEVVNFMACLFQEKLQSPYNLVISSLATELLISRSYPSEELRSENFSMALKSFGLLFDEDCVLSLPWYLRPVHWIYVFVSISERTVFFCDSQNHTGSLSQHAVSYGPMIVRALQFEHDKRVGNGKLPKDHLFEYDTWKSKDLPVPRQCDGYNCGVFIILFMYRIMKNVARKSALSINHMRKDLTNIELNQIREKLVDIFFLRASINDLEDFDV